MYLFIHLFIYLFMYLFIYLSILYTVIAGCAAVACGGAKALRCHYGWCAKVAGPCQQASALTELV